MLNRLTRAAQSVIVAAYESARLDGSPEIGEEHLLLGLLDDAEGRALLEGVTSDSERAQIKAEVEQVRRHGGLTATETDALAGLGIDVDAVVRQIEEQFGVDALADSGSRSPSRWCPAMSGSAGLVLEEAERQLCATGGRSLTVAHLALGLVSARGGVFELLARRGVTVDTVQASARSAARAGGRR